MTSSAYTEQATFLKVMTMRKSTMKSIASSTQLGNQTAPSRQVKGGFKGFPKIGEFHPDIGGRFAGICLGDSIDYCLFYIADSAEQLFTWEQAMRWAPTVRAGAMLPNKTESWILQGNLPDLPRFYLDMYWTRDESLLNPHLAWLQGWRNGTQSALQKHCEASARVVVRMPLSEFLSRH